MMQKMIQQDYVHVIPVGFKKSIKMLRIGVSSTRKWHIFLSQFEINGERFENETFPGAFRKIMTNSLGVNPFLWRQILASLLRG